MEKPFENTLEQHMEILSECIKNKVKAINGGLASANELCPLIDAFNQTFELWKNY